MQDLVVESPSATTGRKGEAPKPLRRFRVWREKVERMAKLLVAHSRVCKEHGINLEQMAALPEDGNLLEFARGRRLFQHARQHW